MKDTSTFYRISKGLFFFRIYGYGFLFKNLKTAEYISYSNRNKLGGLYIGSYAIKILKP